jgi:hypothetical protein
MPVAGCLWSYDESTGVWWLSFPKSNGLERGDIGAVVHRYSGREETYEVEFVTGEGDTVAVLTLGRDEVRPMDQREILHARELAA